MGPFGDTEELTAATLLLSSEKAGNFIRRPDLPAEGGFSVTSI